MVGVLPTPQASRRVDAHRTPAASQSFRAPSLPFSAPSPVSRQKNRQTTPSFENRPSRGDILCNPPKVSRRQRDKCYYVPHGSTAKKKQNKYCKIRQRLPQGSPIWPRKKIKNTTTQIEVLHITSCHGPRSSGGCRYELPPSCRVPSTTSAARRVPPARLSFRVANDNTVACVRTQPPPAKSRKQRERASVVSAGRS